MKSHHLKQSHVAASTALFLIFLAVSALTVSTASAAQVYKYEDESGNVVYSDTPPEGEENMAPAELPDIILQPAVEVPERLNIGNGNAADISVSITTPENETTVLSVESAISVSANSSRVLINGEKAVLLINGAEYASGSALNWSITEIERGEMRLVVQILSKNDKVLSTSDTVLIHVQRNIARQPVHHQ